MQDDLTSRDGREEANRSRAAETPAGDPRRPTKASDVDRLVDREVPIELTRMPDMVHAWLDGEAPESSVRGARHVEFWKRLDRDLEIRRHVMAPADMTERIMEALPTAAPRLAAPWWTRPVAMNPLAVAATAAGLIATGVAIGAALRR